MVDCVSCLRNFPLRTEVPLLLLFFAFIVSDSIRSNLIIYRTCYVTLKYNESECALLGTPNSDNETQYLEKVVQPYVAVISMVHSLLTQSFSVIICFFAGPWSDRFGRRPLLLIPLIGFFFSYLLLAIFAAFSQLSPWYSLITDIPAMLTGGGSTYLTVILCYISDMTSESNRGMRMGSFEAALSLGIFLGNISSSFIFYATNYSTVFLISAVCCLIVFIYTFFFLPESLTVVETEGRLRGLFQLSNIKEMLKTTFRKRENFDRATVLCCVLSLTIFIVTISDGSIIFLFLREKFHWSLEKYTLYTSAHNVTWILGTLIGVYLIHKLLKIPETIMLLLGYISMLNGVLLQGLATQDWEIYAGAGIRSFGGVLSPMSRSLVSKVVSNEEVGKIFALIVTSESLFGLAGTPLYTAIYNETIDTNPSIFNFAAAGFYMVEVIIAIAIIIMRTVRNNAVRYDQLVNEQNEETSDISREEVVG